MLQAIKSIPEGDTLPSYCKTNNQNNKTHRDKRLTANP